jgi:hypothetical protein
MRCAPAMRKIEKLFYRNVLTTRKIQATAFVNSSAFSLPLSEDLMQFPWELDVGTYFLYYFSFIILLTVSTHTKNFQYSSKNYFRLIIILMMTYISPKFRYVKIIFVTQFFCSNFDAYRSRK